MDVKIRNWILAAGDIIVMYASLVLALLLRQGTGGFSDFLDGHFWPFTIINLAWVAVFFIADLYSGIGLRLSQKFFRAFTYAMLANSALTVAVFYLITVFGITPKTNLILYIIIFCPLFLLWRRLFGQLTIDNPQKETLAFMNLLPADAPLVKKITDDPFWGYNCIGELEASSPAEISDRLLRELRLEHGLLVIGRGEPAPNSELLYSLIRNGVHVTDTTSLWEEVFSELPIDNMDIVWFVNNLQNNRSRQPFRIMKRSCDVIGAVITAVITAPLVPFIVAAIKISSPGDVLFSQTRLGRGGKTFRLFKFRTMFQDAEKDGARWATKNDPRVTRVGKFLRHTHLDELPQLWNILRGEMSFIGPRPERPEFAAVLEKRIPYYGLRHLVRPGITGWAQINYKYGSSEDDAKRKLAFDLYYLKNQSPFTELKVALKTALMIFRGEGR